MSYYIDENKETAVKYEGRNAFTWNVSTRRFDLPVSDVSPKSRMTRCSEFEARCYLFEHDPADYVGMLGVLNDMWEDVPNRDPDMFTSVAKAETFRKECDARRAKYEPYLTNYRNGIQSYLMENSEYGKFLESTEKVLPEYELMSKVFLKLAKGHERLAQLSAERAKCESATEQGD